jgi:hypothetical protein
MSGIKQSQYPGSGRPRLLLPLLAMLAAASGPAAAYDWQYDYGADATVGRDDNFRLSEDDPVTTNSASVGVFTSLNGSSEISSLGLRAGASGTSYSASSIEDSENYYVSLSSARSGERWSGTLDLSYNLEPTTESELLDTGNLVDGERRSTRVAPGLSYRLDERTSIYANLSFSDVSYDTLAFTEYTDKSLGAGWVYQLSEISEVSINSSVSEYDPADDDTTTITNLNLGYGRNTSEATRYNLVLGYAESDTPTATDRDGSSSFEVTHSIDDRNGFGLFLGRGYVSSGAGNVRYETRLNLRWDHALAERMQFNLSAEGTSSSERDFLELVAGGSHQLTREVRLAANYRYRAEQGEFNDADSNSVFFSLSYFSI